MKCKDKAEKRRKNNLKFKNKLYKKNWTNLELEESNRLSQLHWKLTNVGKLWNPDDPMKCSGARSRKSMACKEKSENKKRKTKEKRKTSLFM